MFSPPSGDRPLPSLGFWVSEGFGSGLTLAGVTPCEMSRCGPDEVHTEKAGRLGRLLRWVFPDDIAGAP